MRYSFRLPTFFFEEAIGREVGEDSLARSLGDSKLGLGCARIASVFRRLWRGFRADRRNSRGKR